MEATIVIHWSAKLQVWWAKHNGGMFWWPSIVAMQNGADALEAQGYTVKVEQ